MGIWTVLMVLLAASASTGLATHEHAQAKAILRKQQQCEGLIRETIEEILDDDDVDPDVDIPYPDDSYHDCKLELDRLKRDYILAYSIDTTSEFFPVKTSEGTQTLVSVPAEEQDEINDLEFDVTEELCVTNKLCTELQKLADNGKENAQTRKNKEKSTQCHNFLELIKHKYTHDKNLDETNLKSAGGLSVMCLGKTVLMSLPHTLNNADYHVKPDELFGDAFKGSDTQFGETPLGDEPSEEGEEKKEEAGGEEESSKETGSDAAVDRANIVYCVLAIFVFIAVF